MLSEKLKKNINGKLLFFLPTTNLGTKKILQLTNDFDFCSSNNVWIFYKLPKRPLF